MVSMTGYGEASFTLQGVRFYYRLRSLNSRFLEVSLHFPPELQWFESEAEKIVRERFVRGRIEVHLESERELPKKPKLNTQLIQEYQKLFMTLYPEKKSQLPLEALVQLPGSFELRSDNLKNYQPKLGSYLLRALLRLQREKQREGRKIFRYVKAHLRLLSRIHRKTRVLNREHYQKQRKNLSQKIIKPFEEYQEKPERWDKNTKQLFSRQAEVIREEMLHFFYSDITEEIDRLNIHLTTVLELLEQERISGKKLEFFLQELLREVNTLTAKTKDPMVNQQGIQMKSEIEKLREHVRNVE